MMFVCRFEPKEKKENKKIKKMKKAKDELMLPELAVFQN
jgi:hypothetical protein